MSDTTGTFRIDFEVENPTRSGARCVVRSALVGTESVLSWIPSDILESAGVERYRTARCRSANGTVLERWTGSAFIHFAERLTVDDVVFGEPGDLVLLGWRSLDGLNLRIDPALMQLVDAGPHPAAIT